MNHSLVSKAPARVRRSGRRTALARTLAVGAALAASQAPAHAQASIAFDVPAGTLEDALNRVARQAGITLAFDPTLVAGKSAAALRGTYTVQEALQLLVASHGLQPQRAADGSYTLRAMPVVATAPAAAASAAEPTLDTVRVTARRESDFGDVPPSTGVKADTQASATKMAMPLRQTPQAVTVVTADAIANRQARDTTSALELSAGMVPSASSSVGGPFAGRGLESGEQFSLRGQDLHSGRDLRIDGFSVSASQFDLALFEGVEVIKGPASMLYGQGSVGGFINYVRKKPQADRSAVVATTAGSWDSYRAQVDATGAVDSNGVLRARVIGVKDKGGSFIDHVWTDRETLAPSVDVRIGNSTRVLLEALYQKDKFMPSHGIPLFVDGDKLRIPNIPRSRLTGLPSQDASWSEDVLVDAKVDQEITDRWLATLVLNKARQRFSRYFDNYAHGGLAANGDTNLYADRMQTTDNSWAGELRVSGRFDAFGREHQVLVGAETNKRSTDGLFGYAQVGTGNIYTGDFTNVTGPLSRDLPVNPFSATIRNRGVYGQVLLGVAERTKLLIGARRDRAEQGTQADAETKSASTVRVALTQDLGKHFTAYTSYAESFSPVEATGWGGEVLDPERGRGYEAGLKGEWNDKQLLATLALYNLELDNRPVPDPDPSHPNASISSGLQRTRGLEIEIAGKPMAGVEISAGASWASSKYKDPNDGAYGLVPYGFIGRNAGVSASYEWGSGVLNGFKAGATYVYVGRRSFAYYGVPTWVNGATTDQLWFPGYDRIDLNFSYSAIKNWKISLQVRNLFDKVYIERMRDIESNNYFGSPRAFQLRAEYTFK
ncbi:MAG: TonB-dependent siderophore receptor [Rhizobacter sp.]